jgi:hypothetical protein
MSSGAAVAATGFGRSTTTIRGHLSNLKADLGSGGLKTSEGSAFGALTSAAASAEGNIKNSMARIKSCISFSGGAKSSTSESLFSRCPRRPRPPRQG